MPSKDHDRTAAYAEAVVAGAIVAGPLVRRACQRHLDDRARWGTTRSPAVPYYFDQDAADRAIRFIEGELVLADVPDVDGLPSPFRLQPWQAFIVGSLFGWKQTSDDCRRYRTGYIEVAKGNGKTPLAAAVGLYLLTVDGEPFPEVYSAAVSHKQAQLIWTDACRMREHGPRIRDYVEQTAHTLVTRAGGKFEAISSEYRGLEGKRPHGVLIDELHEHPNDQVTTKMRRGTKGRRQALILEITNSGYDRQSICYQHHEYSRRVLDGLVDDPSWFAYVCGLDLEAGDDWRDPSVWIKANPNLGVSIQPRYLEEAVREATGMPAAEADVRRLNFCEWTDKQTAYLPTAAWVTCRQPMTEAELQRHPSVAALDLGEADDMSAFAVVWRLAEERFHTKVWFWTCEAAEQRYSDRPYALWRRSGALTVTPGNVTDYVRIRNDVRTIATRLGVKRIAFDRRGALQLSQELLGDGFDMRDQGQGFFLSEGTKKLAALVAAGHLTHDGHAVLDWQAGNLSVVRGTRGDIRPVKTFGPDKIDGMVALIMALQHAVMPAAPQPPTSHVYERKPVLIL